MYTHVENLSKHHRIGEKVCLFGTPYFHLTYRLMLRIYSCTAVSLKAIEGTRKQTAYNLELNGL